MSSMMLPMTIYSVVVSLSYLSTLLLLLLLLAIQERVFAKDEKTVDAKTADAKTVAPAASLSAYLSSLEPWNYHVLTAVVLGLVIAIVSLRLAPYFRTYRFRRAARVEGAGSAVEGGRRELPIVLSSRSSPRSAEDDEAARMRDACVLASDAHAIEGTKQASQGSHMAAGWSYNRAAIESRRAGDIERTKAMKKLAGDAFATYAQACVRKGKTKQATVYFEEAADAYQAAHDHTQSAIYFQRVAEMCAKDGREQRAREMHQRSGHQHKLAAKAHVEKGDQKEAAESLRKASKAYSSGGAFTMARECIEKAAEGVIAFPTQSEDVISLIKMADAHMARFEYIEAADLYMVAATLNAGQNLRQTAAANYEQAAEAYRRGGADEKANEMNRQAAHLRKQVADSFAASDNPMLAATVYDRVIGAYTQLGDTEQAKEASRLAGEQYFKMATARLGHGNHMYAMLYYESAAKAYSAGGDEDNAEKARELASKAQSEVRGQSKGSASASTTLGASEESSDVVSTVTSKASDQGQKEDEATERPGDGVTEGQGDDMTEGQGEDATAGRKDDVTESTSLGVPSVSSMHLPIPPSSPSSPMTRSRVLVASDDDDFEDIGGDRGYRAEQIDFKERDEEGKDKGRKLVRVEPSHPLDQSGPVAIGLLATSSSAHSSHHPVLPSVGGHDDSSDVGGADPDSLPPPPYSNIEKENDLDASWHFVPDDSHDEADDRSHHQAPQPSQSNSIFGGIGRLLSGGLVQFMTNPASGGGKPKVDDPSFL